MLNQTQMKTLISVKIEEFRNNTIIMDFVTLEALEKVASEIRAKTNSGTTAKAVKVLICSKRNDKIKRRVDQYISVGLHAAVVVWIDSFKKSA